MPSANVSLSEQQAEFIRQSIDGGRFQNASEVVRAGLHLLKLQTEQDKIKLEHLRRMAKEGFDDIDRGDFDVITQDTLVEFLDAVRAAKPTTRKKQKR